jgi:NADH dehydrogenase [ubiquinone] 1 alpha subcomplex assembly factor 5
VRPKPASEETKLMASAVPSYAGPVKRPGSRTGRTLSGRCAARRCLYIRGMDDRDIMTVFDRETVRRHRDRAAAGFPAYDFLFTEIAERLGDRLDDVVRDFPMALDLGCHTGQVGRVLGGHKGIETLVECDLSPAMVRLAGGGLRVAGDEELLPFADSSFDLAISNLSLHWVNDLPGALLQLRRALKPDGLFMGAMLGGDTLFELRRCLMEAELDLTGGVSARISPFAEVRDAGGLLQRAGFTLPVVDSDTITVTYESAFKLMTDLRGMGETNAGLNRRKHPTPRVLMIDAARRYAELYSEPDGRVAATFQVLYLAGWAPHESQQKPMKPGTAQIRLADALKAEERSVWPAGGDKTEP